MKEMTEQQALSILAAECSRVERSSGEMLEKMRRWQLQEDVRARIMAYLMEHKYVDDERFARAFVADKIKYNKWGRRKIEQALWTKRIDKSISDRILDEMGDFEYLKVLRPLLENKRKATKAANDYELNMKLVRFALGRGFTMDIIRQVIDEAEEMGEYGEDC